MLHESLNLGTENFVIAGIVENFLSPLYIISTYKLLIPSLLKRNVNVSGKLFNIVIY